MSKNGSTATSSNSPPPQVMQAYQNVMNRANQVANTPLQQYQGPMVAGFQPAQVQAMNEIGGMQGVADPYINAAAQEYGKATTPLWGGVQQFSPGAVNQYMSPYTNDVVQATQSQFANQNAQAAQGLASQAIGSGAFGGDRASVAQGILAGQQQTAQAPVLAGLRQQGYNTGLQTFLQEQQAQLGANEANSWLNSQAAFGLGNLGQEALGTGLESANALMGVGGMQQQLQQAQLNVPYEQFLQQQAYPFQTTQWLGNIAEGVGSGMGSTSSTTTPGP
ncbi:MAG: hypothetical protein KGL26_11815, partial [Pseudomonadota bacterium]|nr:hypothetical protein [Pseudomonadota bacterium]